MPQKPMMVLASLMEENRRLVRLCYMSHKGYATVGAKREVSLSAFMSLAFPLGFVNQMTM